ncbi:MAG: DUF4330 family protein [Ruminococcaceae bacterium]|nr:DUF4330 family protein [Oscillospiraceae bacterium]
MNRKNEAQQPEKAERKRRRAQQEEKEPKQANSRRWLFLLVDLLLLAVIVVAVIFLISLLTPWSVFDNDKAQRQQITYTVEIAGVDQGSLAALQVGDTVTDRKTGAVIGTVTAINNRDYEVYSRLPSDKIDEDLGAFVVEKVTYPEDSGLMTVTVTLTVEADYEKGVGYTVGDSRIAVGRSFDLVFRNYTDTGVCVGLETK